MKNSIHLNMEKTPLELRLLLFCLRASGGQDCVHRIGELCEQIREWDEFLRLLERHRVVSPVYNGLKRVKKKNIPKDLLVDLRNRARINSQLVLVKSAQLVQIVEQFQTKGIPVLPFKGPVTGLLAYGDIGMRHFSDLDIIVAPNRFREAERILFEQGFRRQAPCRELTPKEWSVYFRNNHHTNYTHSTSELRVELHWRFGSNPYLFPLEFDVLWRDRQILKLGGLEIPTLGNEHMMLILCTHGAIHTWSALFWLNDVARLAAQKDTFDWSRLMAISDRVGTSRMMAEGLILAHLFLGSPLPELIKTWAAADKVAVRYVGIFLQLLSSTEYPSYRPFTRQYFFYIMRRPMLRKDLRYLFASAINILTAGFEDLRKFPLLNVFIPLYLSVRGIRWFLRWYVPGSRVFKEGPMGQDRH